MLGRTQDIFESSISPLFLSTPETLLHPTDGTERGSHTTPDQLWWGTGHVQEDKSRAMGSNPEPQDPGSF